MRFPRVGVDSADVAAISAGSSHSLALLKDGTVRAWARNRWGQSAMAPPPTATPR
jgi:alpha-tubulin suppressor-like RCC1 family protein